MPVLAENPALQASQVVASQIQAEQPTRPRIRLKTGASIPVRQFRCEQIDLVARMVPEVVAFPRIRLIGSNELAERPRQCARAHAGHRSAT